MPTSVFEALMAIIAERRRNPPPRSYTVTLFEGGVDLIGRKVLEEAAETVDAARGAGSDQGDHLAHEVADLLYHVFVLLGYCDVPLARVEQKLADRFGISGLDEKASRSRHDSP